MKGFFFVENHHNFCLCKQKYIFFPPAPMSILFVVYHLKCAENKLMVKTLTLNTVLWSTSHSAVKKAYHPFDFHDVLNTQKTEKSLGKKVYKCRKCRIFYFLFYSGWSQTL